MRWDPRKNLVSLVIATFVLLVGLRLHGFSISMWDHYLDGDQHADVLGTAQGIRSDDWIALIPALVSQTTRADRLKKSSNLLGPETVNTIATTPLPALTWQLAFRPHHWGYLIGPEIGLSWHWWFRVFLVFSSASFLAMQFGAPKQIALLLGGILGMAPFLWFWSFASEPVVGWMLASLSAAVVCFRARGCPTGWYVFLFYALCCFAFGGFYPPFQIPAALILMAASLGLFLESRSIEKLGLFIVSGISAVCVFGINLWQNRDDIMILANTDYPGARVALGGQGSWTEVLASTFTQFSSKIDWTPLGNICEASGFVVFFPVTVGLLLLNRALLRRPLILCLSVLMVLFYVRNLVGAPVWLNNILGLSLVPEKRLAPLAGLLDNLLFVITIGSAVAVRSTLTSKYNVFAIATAGVSVIYAIALVASYGEATEFYKANRWLPSLLLLSFFAGLIFRHRYRLALSLMLVVMTVKGLSFNPLARGGIEKIRRSPLSQSLLSQSSCSQWAAFDTIVHANLFRMLGLRAANGTHFQPHLSFWKHFDPSGIHKFTYNRYAHVVMEVNQDIKEPSIMINPSPDVVILRTHPDRAEWDHTDVDCLLIMRDKFGPEKLKEFTKWETIGDVGNWRMLRRI